MFDGSKVKPSKAQSQPASGDLCLGKNEVMRVCDEVKGDPEGLNEVTKWRRLRAVLSEICSVTGAAIILMPGSRRILRAYTFVSKDDGGRFRNEIEAASARWLIRINLRDGRKVPRSHIEIAIKCGVILGDATLITKRPLVSARRR